MKFNGKIGYTLVILFGALGMYVQTKMQEQQIKEQVDEYMDTHKNELTQQRLSSKSLGEILDSCLFMKG